MHRVTKDVAWSQINIQSHRQTEEMKTVTSLNASTDKTLEETANYITAKVLH